VPLEADPWDPAHPIKYRKRKTDTTTSTFLNAFIPYYLLRDRTPVTMISCTDRALHLNMILSSMTIPSGEWDRIIIRVLRRGSEEA
jgi:hypothetical protein